MKKILPLLLACLLVLTACTTTFPDELLTLSDTVTDGTTDGTTDGSNGEDPEVPSDTPADTPTGTLPSGPSGTVPEPEPPKEPDETSEGILDPEDPELPAEDDHTDADNDGSCDDCGISVVIVLDLFAINDLHGKFKDSNAQPGVDELTTYLKNAYETEDHVLLLSSGDMWQGSSESNLTRGYIITEWMNELNFASMTIGNHEYDWGSQYIANNATLAGFPFLAINIYDRETNERVDYCASSVLVQRGGARIGIIGAVGDCYSSISGEQSGDIYFKTGRDLTALVQAESEKLREAGADFIIYSIHDGHGSSSSGVGSISDSQLSSYYDPVLSEGYVDIVFEGHTHQSYVLRDGDGVYHMQNGGDNKGISHAEAVINFANGQSSVRTAEFVPNSVYANLEDDPIVETLLEKYKEQVSAGDEQLGMNDSYRSSEYLCQLSADLYLKTGLEAFGDQYQIVLGGGFMSTRAPYNLSAGMVTYSQLQMILPFDNTLVLCSIKGSDLKSKFINTSNSRYYISYSEYGNSVKNRIDNNATYYIIVDTYTSTYAPNRLTEVARYTEGVYARDLVAEYIKAGGMTSGTTEVTYTSIPEILAIGEKLADNGQTNVSYYVKGTVVSVDNTTYGNMTIRDEAGKTLYVYGVYDSTGANRYDSMANAPVAGDEVVLFGPVKRYVYNGKVTIELLNARVMSST